MIDFQNKAVVFDTNAYRIFGRNKTFDELIVSTNELISLENKKNIKAFSPVITSYELLAHLADDPNSGGYKDCLNGIIAMAYHCWDDETNRLRTIPQTSLHITTSCFGVRNSETEKRNQNLSGIIQDIKIFGQTAVDHHQASFREIASDITVHEEGFSSVIAFLVDRLASLLKGTNSNLSKRELSILIRENLKSHEFKNMMARTILTILAKDVNYFLLEEKASKMAILLNKHFPITTGFYSWICHEIYIKNVDLKSKNSRKKRWNWLWDYEISSNISESTIDKREVILVTSDGEMKEVLNEYSYLNRFFTLFGYCKMLSY